jgi:membrane protease YdiL (CAAX protease family)
VTEEDAGDEDRGEEPGAATSEGAPEPDRGRIVVAAVLFEAGLAPAALGLGWLLGQPPLEGASWSARAVGLGVLAALPMYGLFRVGLRWPIGPLGEIKRFFDRELLPLLGGRPASDLALIALAAGFGEEMLFRGVCQGTLQRWLGTWSGLGAASLLFGLLHPITPAYCLIAGLLGAYLGAVWIGTGNLVVVIIAHALYDFLALLALLREPDDGGDHSRPD